MSGQGRPATATTTTRGQWDADGRAAVATSRQGRGLAPQVTASVPPSTSSAAQPDAGRPLWKLVVVAYFCATAIPPLISIQQSGRQPGTIWGIAVLAESRLADRVQIALFVVLGLLCLVAIATGAPRPRRGATLGFLLLAVAVCVASSLAAAAPSREYVPIVVNVLCATAVWRLAPDLRDLAFVGHVAATLAVGSIAFALLSDNAWMAGTLDPASESKAILGSAVLAGPYPHMNNLGMSIALAMPFVAGRRDVRLRVVEWTLLGAALLLTASRTSLIGVAAGLVFAAVVARVGSVRLRRTVTGVVLVAVGAVSLAMPWLTNESSAFTRRGQIWLWSRAAVAERPVTGYGISAFGNNSSLSDSIGKVAGAAHNLGLHYLVVGGVLAVLAVVACVAAAATAACRALDRSVAPATYLVVLLVISIAEMPFRVESTIGQAWVGIPLLVAVGTGLGLGGRSAPEPVARPGLSGSGDGPAGP